MSPQEALYNNRSLRLEKRKKQKNKTRKMEMLKVGLIGAGVMGQTHSAVYSNLPDVRLTAIADVDEKKAGKLAWPHKARIYKNLEELLQDDEVDMVDVCLPTDFHARYTIMAARAGKHILCEKPIALNLAEAERMINAARRAKVKFMVAHCIRFWPEYVAFKKIVDSGRYGKLKSIWLSRISPTPIWSWRNWLMNPRKSGGAVLDLHIHDIDYLLYLLGKPEAVYCQGRKDKRGWAHLFATYKYKDATATAEAGWDMPARFPFKMAFRANFARDTVVEFSLLQSPTLLVYERNRKPYAPKVTQPKVKSKSSSSGNIAALGGYFNEIQYFTKCIMRNETPKVVTPSGAREALRLGLAEIKSCETGRIIRL